ncbi:MAG: GNAT family N-acetyltransferase [Alistipes sp.]|nr:GNAT family N-acetyltransferase [Alistipes senegalensis]MCM1249688.1 GNAT family N-acetyltransferase [Alistipes sp.]
MTIEPLPHPAGTDLDALTDLWEASVRATHDFLTADDLLFYRRLVREEALAAATLHIIRDSAGEFAAFAGTEGDKLEMLFVGPAWQGRGLGRRLVEHVRECCGVRCVDVNEQNRPAAAFYARLGFRIVSRDAFDPSGRPHPILHLEYDPSRRP